MALLPVPRISLLLCIIGLISSSACFEDDDLASPSPGDHDGDGWTEDEDCDDTVVSINPGAHEVCNGRDDDCDAKVDEDVMTTFFLDADQDLYGDPESSTLLETCETPPGYVQDGQDCDDQDASIYPDAPEICDGEDNDCNRLVDDSPLDPSTYYLDLDGDGFGTEQGTMQACTPPKGYATNALDCDDLSTLIRPGATETCDSLDNDCDEEVDEGFDNDRDGIPDCQGVEICDGVDNNLNGLIDEGFDQDSDGFTPVSCACRPDGISSCGLDCDDSNEAVKPTATEVCDSIDNNCDGKVDEEPAVGTRPFFQDLDNDGYGNPEVSEPACYAETGWSASSLDCDDQDPLINPAVPELCNQRDDDCDDIVDDGLPTYPWHPDLDADGFGATSTVVFSCSTPEGMLEDGTDCDDTSDEIHPEALEVCDTLDNNCDGQVDDSSSVDASEWYPDVDEDGHGGNGTKPTVACDAPQDGAYALSNDDCNDFSSITYPEAPELYDQLDNDCDGRVDEALFDQALTFDGLDDLVLFAPEDSPTLGPTATLEAWVRIDGYAADWQASFLHKWGDSSKGTAGIALAFVSSLNTFGLFASTNGRDVQEVMADTRIIFGTWYHVAGQYDGNRLELFVNGELAASLLYSRTPFDNGLGLALGGMNPQWTNGAFTLPGALAEVRISRGALYTDTFVPSPRLEADANTLLLLHLEECGGQMVRDSSGRDIFGTLGLTADSEGYDPVWTCLEE